ncbi:hypothetical protein ACOSQ4_014768 [Xanthoceras sorbifolium]
MKKMVDTIDQHDKKEISDKSVYGPWLMVYYDRNNRKLDGSRESSKGYKTSSSGNNGRRIGGSRFEISSDEEIEHERSTGSGGKGAVGRAKDFINNKGVVIKESGAKTRKTFVK